MQPMQPPVTKYRSMSVAAVTAFGARRNAINPEISFKTTTDVHRWCHLQTARHSTENPGSVSSLVAWRQSCLDYADRCPTWFSIGFNAFDLDQATLIGEVVGVFASLGLLEAFQIGQAALRAFLADVQAAYHADNAYHNFVHAVDVFQMLLNLMIRGRVIDSMTPRSMLVVLLAALLHDIGHPSLRNIGAISGNLELYHADRADRLLSLHPSILVNVPDVDVARAQIAECILSTDISLDAQWRASFPRGPKRSALLGSSQYTTLLLQLVIRASDISNVVRPLPTATLWSNALGDEVFGHKRSVEAFNVAATIKFCQGIAGPIFQLLSEMWPKTSVCLQAMHDNIAAWKRQVDPK